MEKIELSRLQDFYNENPNLRYPLELKFPELITPEVFEGNLFMRDRYPDALYSMVIRNGDFQIFNVTHGKLWGKALPPTNKDCQIQDPFLSEADFGRLLKRSGVSRDSVVILQKECLRTIHKTLFKNQ